MNKHMKIFLVALVVVLAGTVGFALAQTMVVPVAKDPNAAAAEMAKDAAAAVGGELTPFSEAWFKKTKEPVPWFKWGADIRTRDEYTNNLAPLPGQISLNKHAKGHEVNYGRFRERIWATITPVKDIDLFMRFTNEFRVYSEPDKNDLRDVTFSEVVFDNLYVKYRNAFGLPVTLTIGRQDIFLGDGWLINEGTPKDGSRTAYFDAIRVTTEFKDANTTVDTIYLQDYANAEATWLPPMNPRELALMDQNERGAILYVTNKSIKDTEISPYFIYKQDRDAHMEGVTFGGPADIYTFGVRVAHDFDKHWRARAEIAKQLGHKNYEDLCALGFNSRLSYFANDEMNNNFRLSYEYRSGDRPSTDTIERFDPLWGRWPQFSEAFSLLGTEGRSGDVANIHRIGMGWSFNPTKKDELCTDYHLLFTDQQSLSAGNGSYSESGCFRGQLVTFLYKHTFNDHIRGLILTEFFFPGDYYTDLKNDVGTFIRAELFFTW